MEGSIRQLNVYHPAQCHGDHSVSDKQKQTSTKLLLLDLRSGRSTEYFKRAVFSLQAKYLTSLYLVFPILSVS